jgi:hypothetical protein
MSITPVPVSIRLVRAPMAASRGKVHPEVRAVGPELLSRHRQLDGLQQRVRRDASRTVQIPGRTGHVNRSGRYVVSSGSDDFVSTAAVSRGRPIRMGA